LDQAKLEVKVVIVKVMFTKGMTIFINKEVDMYFCFYERQIAIILEVTDK
jgi:hypothetical protein